MRKSRRNLLLPIVAVGVAAALSACYAPVAAAPAPTPTRTAVVPYGDGVLTIGTLTTVTGPAAAEGAAQIAGVELAVRAINEAGGVAGLPVRVFHRDVGDASAATLEASFGELAAKGVDVVVGPADPTLVERLTPLAVAARVGVVALTAGSTDTAAQDPDGYIAHLRAGSGSIGDAVAAELADGRAAILPVDGWGDQVAEAAVTARGVAGVAADASVVVEAGSSIASRAADAADALDAVADTVIVAGSSASDLPSVVAALLGEGIESSQIVVATDTTPDLVPLALLSPVEGVRILVPGALPNDAFRAGLLSMDPSLTTTALAAEAYDAVILAALGATTAGDDGGQSVLAAMPAASSTWIACMSYAECLAVLATEDDIDYHGVSGPVDLDDAGNVTAAAIPQYAVAASGEAVYQRSVVVSIPPSV